MTNEQAYKILTEHTRQYVPMYDAEALEVAIEAVKKRIPEKPTELTNIYPAGQYECGCGCGWSNGIWKGKFCPNCGQALDWGDTK